MEWLHDKKLYGLLQDIVNAKPILNTNMTHELLFQTLDKLDKVKIGMTPKQIAAFNQLLDDNQWEWPPEEI